MLGIGNRQQQSRVREFCLFQWCDQTVRNLLTGSSQEFARLMPTPHCRACSVARGQSRGGDEQGERQLPSIRDIYIESISGDDRATGDQCGTDEPRNSIGRQADAWLAPR
jgi:hypothetical protein